MQRHQIFGVRIKTLPVYYSTIFLTEFKKIMPETIRVVCRFRPENKREKKEAKEQVCLILIAYDMISYSMITHTFLIFIFFFEIKGLKPKPIQITKSNNGDSLALEQKNDKKFVNFGFDSILNNVNQEIAFENIALQTCEDALNGYNGTIFAC